MLQWACPGGFVVILLWVALVTTRNSGRGIFLCNKISGTECGTALY